MSKDVLITPSQSRIDFDLETYIYFDGITDFVRIYTINPSLKRLEDIRDKYNIEIKKYTSF